MLRKMLFGLLITSLISSSALAGGPEIVPPPAPHLRPFIGINYILKIINEDDVGRVLGYRPELLLRFHQSLLSLLPFRYIAENSDHGRPALPYSSCGRRFHWERCTVLS